MSDYPDKIPVIDELILHTSLYELYKEDWMNQNISPDDRFYTFRNYKLTQLADDEFNGSFEDYLWDNGGFLSGSLYVCFNEFLDAEYQDREYIKDLVYGADIADELKEKIMETYDFYNREAEYGSLPEDLEGYEYVKNEEFYNEEYTAENLYFLLYYNFMDPDIDHFRTKTSHAIDDMSHEEVIESCVELIHHVSEEGLVSEEDFLNSYNFPLEFSDTLKEIKEALEHEKDREMD